MLLFILLYMVIAVVDQFLVTSTVDIRELPLGHYIPMGMVDPNVGVLVLIYRPIMAIPTIAVTIRRLRDVGKSGWWCLLWVLPVPVVGWLYLVPLLCKPSSVTSSTGEQVKEVFSASEARLRDRPEPD